MLIPNYFLVALTLSMIYISDCETLNLDCGVRPPRAISNPWSSSKYGPFGWDNPQRAAREEFPWMVGIFRKIKGFFKYECGGTLIPGLNENEVLILTGARCVTKNFNSSLPASRLQDFRVVVSPSSSNYNKNNNELGAQKFGIRRIEIHPLYETKNYDSDAAIVQLNGIVHLGPLALPVCLPPDNSAPMGITYNMVGEISGFGWDTRRNVTEGLRYARYPVVMSQTCQDKLSVKVNDYLEFCTGYEKDSTACQGDYGGGLVFQHPRIKGRYFLQGLLSNLDATPITEDGYCENYNKFKRIGPYLQWIRETQIKMDSGYGAQPLPKPRPTSGLPLNQHVPEFAKITRDLHNHYRAIHKVPSVRLVEKIQQEALRLAKEIAEGDSVEVPNENDYPYSTNIFIIPKLVTAQDAVREAVQNWYESFKTFDRDDPQPSAFTQMIWKSSTQIGVGVATDGDKTVVVVNYWPKGNFLYKGDNDYQRKKSYQDNVRVISHAF